MSSESESTCFEQTVAALDKLSSDAQRVLKREWTRVKNGEPRYKRAITVAKYMGIGLAVCLGGLVGYAAIRAI